jgi:hypothetical protein
MCADVVVSSAVLVLKALVTSQVVVAASPLAIVAGLAQHIDEIRHPQARKCVLWLVGGAERPRRARGRGVVGARRPALDGEVVRTRGSAIYVSARCTC